MTNPLDFNDNHLSIVNDAVGVRAVYNSDTRVHLALEEIRGKLEIRECSGNYQLKVKVSDLIETFKVAIEQKTWREVTFYSKHPTPSFAYCFIN